MIARLHLSDLLKPPRNLILPPSIRCSFNISYEIIDQCRGIGLGLDILCVVVDKSKVDIYPALQLAQPSRRAVCTTAPVGVYRPPFYRSIIGISTATAHDGDSMCAAI